MKTVAIVGAGLAGLVVARGLQDIAGVTVFEKSRGPGGRMATRYAGDFEFDHGAQFFTARTDEFRRYLSPLLSAGVVAEWPARFAELNRSRVLATRVWDEEYPHLVGAPGMNAIGKYLAAGLDVRYNATVAAVERRDAKWILRDPAGHRLGESDWLVLTAPASQTARLAAESPKLASLCRERRMRGCFALMLGFATKLNLPWDAALVHGADVSWVSVNSSKPGRSDAFTLLVHSTNAWADAHIDADTVGVMEHMMKEAAAVVGADVATAVHRQVHRWRFANVDKQTGPTCAIDDEKQLAVCGDWLVHGRIEAAFRSASGLSQQLRGGSDGLSS
ncbi:MAG: FAD-dependent oxidoreductase [Pseudomonadota bacterium]